MAIYTELADDIERQIRRGVLRAGERLPSVRSLCTSRGISQGTVMQAYYLLEDRGLVSTRPRSGYFVNATARTPRRLAFSAAGFAALAESTAATRPSIRASCARLS